jgi:hypothetical protein
MTIDIATAIAAGCTILPGLFFSGLTLGKYQSRVDGYSVQLSAIFSKLDEISERVAIIPSHSERLDWLENWAAEHGEKCPARHHEK